MVGHKKVDYILKWTPRKQDRQALLERGLAGSQGQHPQGG